MERFGGWHGPEGGGLNLTLAAEELETRRRQAGLSLTGLNEQLRRPLGPAEDVMHGRVRKEHRRRK